MKKTYSKSHSGFTLLEVILSVGILLILISIIFNLVSSSLSLSSAVVQQQESVRVHASNFHYLKKLFHNLPPQSKITVETNEYQLQTLTIQNPNTTFPADGAQYFAKQLTLDVVPADDSNVQLLLTFSNQLEEEAEREDKKTLQTVMVESQHFLQWNIYSPVDAQWVETWENEQGRPPQIELLSSASEGDSTHTNHFWVPQRN